MRDGLSSEAAQERIDSQMPIERKKSMADFVIDNSNSLKRSKRQVDDLIKQLMPGYLSTAIAWFILASVAAFLYVTLILYELLDHWRKVGLIRPRKPPVVIQVINNQARIEDIQAAPAEGLILK